MANRGNLSRATDSSDAPTPGYLYLDIAKNAASSPVACQEIATYLTRRLEKHNPNIKYKSLKIIAKTAESPVTRGQFKRVICQNAQAVAAIKECLTYRGQPDPARGDERNARVRSAAKEALDAVYSDTPSSAQHSTANAGLSGGDGGGGISSYGSSPHYSSGGAPPPPSTQKRMEGIGNPMFQDPRNEPPTKSIGNMTIGQVVGVAGETIAGMIKDPLARNVEVSPQQRSSMPGYGSNTYGAPPPGSAQLARETNGQWTMANNRYPNAATTQNNSEYYKARDAAGSGGFQWAQEQQQHQQQSGGNMGGVGGSWGSVATAVPSGRPPSVASQARAPPHGGSYGGGGGGQPSLTHTGAGGTAVSDGSYEKNLIMELCPPGGLKAEPPPDKLASFSRSVPSLNPDLVCPALLDALEDGQPWIIRAKALCVMEVTILVAERHRKDNGDNNAYADFFHACREEIEPLANHPRAAIRDPAKRVLKALGIDNVPTAAAPAAAPPAPPAEVPNLLDFDDDEPAPPSVPPPPPAAPAPPASSGGSLFGGMQVKSSKTVPASNNEGLLGEAPAAPAPTSSSGLFGDIKVKETNTNNSAAAEAQDVGKAAATGGSAFGFINGGAGAPPPAEAPPKAEEAKKPPTKESFDPLLSLGTTTTTSSMSPNNATKQAMQLSTAQMQAMAYQQMMMQQQMQMQQMQMALAMQQGGGPRMQMQQQQTMPNLSGSHRNVMNMNSSGANASSSFSFLDVGSKPPPKEDKKFDFVKDAFKSETKK